jgi:PAS domain S-box-containing protein
MSALINTGIDVLGDIPWGSHFCNFYDTKQDLLDTLVPYFKAGLENKEFCIWVVATTGLITVIEAKRALEQVVPDFDRHLTDGNIEILNESDWYLEENYFSIDRIVGAWNVKLKRALALGYAGMRVSGDTFWLTEKYWKNFYAYEKRLTDFVTDLPITIMCTYPLANREATDILDVVHAHQFTIARRQGEWNVIESPEFIQAKAEVKRLNEELKRFKDRTSGHSLILRYGVAVLLVIIMLIIALWMKAEIGLQSTPVATLFLCAIMFSSWFGGIRPGLLAIALSLLVFMYYFATPLYSLAVDSREIPRLLIFTLSALIIGSLSAAQRSVTETLRTARDVLNGTVQQLKRTNAALQIKIAEHKQAEEKYRLAERELRLVNDTIPALVWTAQHDGSIDFINQRYRDFTGHSLDEVRDWRWTSVIHPEDQSRVTGNWRTALATGERLETEARVRRGNGNYHWLLIYAMPLHDESEKIVKWFGTMTDITERKQAEEELRLTYQYLTYHVENTPLAVIEFDKDLIIKRWSKRAEEIFGWKSSEAFGKNVYDTDFQIIYKEDIAKVDTINEQLMKGMVNRSLSLNRNNTKDGTIIYCEWYNSVLRDELGNVITIISLVHNVTERKIAEDTLNQSYDEIRRLNGHLQKIREEERKHIAREIHDELGQQLTAIKMDVVWIDKKIPEETTAIKSKLKNIIGLLDGSNQSVRRILSELRPVILDEHGLLEAIEWLTRQFTETTGIPVKFTTTEKFFKVPEQIANCIFRIYQEAFTNITRYAQAKKVSSSMGIIEENIILVIEDDGIGFDTGSLQNKKSFGILGMKERVHSLAGKFELVSSHRKGSKIIVSLPYTV